MIIAPEVFVTPDRPVIRFREPREKVSLESELPKAIQAQGWGVGTYFNVQFIDHDRTKLIASAEFVVTEVREGLHTSEANPYQPITRTVFMRKYQQVSQWAEFVAAVDAADKNEVSTHTAPGSVTTEKPRARKSG